MRVLAIDIGMGTTDILVYDSSREMENCGRMVIPSRTVTVAGMIREATASGRPVVFDGVTMGGGPCGKALRKHLEEGQAFIAGPAAALTFNDDLEKVSSWGVRISEAPLDEAPADSTFVWSGDLDSTMLEEVLERLGLGVAFDGYAVAVQDHGFSPGSSNRRHRFRLWRELLREGAGLDSLAWKAAEIPRHYSRMHAVASLLDGKPGVLVMDTGPAALLGALSGDEEKSPSASADAHIVVNIGNGHTLAAILRGEAIVALAEHHTGMLDHRSFGSFVRGFASGSLSDEETFQSGGHGCIPPDEPVGMGRPVIVTGPRRAMALGSGLPLDMAAPHGDMMLTGCFGLVEAWKKVSGGPSS
jgi:uncharacterized protein (DUF1786 family)